MGGFVDSMGYTVLQPGAPGTPKHLARSSRLHALHTLRLDVHRISQLLSDIACSMCVRETSNRG
jgi:hypothetical protein